MTTTQTATPSTNIPLDSYTNDCCKQAIQALALMESTGNMPDGRHPYEVLRSFIQLVELMDRKGRKLTLENNKKTYPEWNDTNIQKAIIMAMNGTLQQKTEAREFFQHHLLV